MKNILLILAVIFLSINVSYAQSFDTIKVSAYEYHLLSSNVQDLLDEIEQGTFENDPNGWIKAKCLNRLHLLDNAIEAILEENLKIERKKEKLK